MTLEQALLDARATFPNFPEAAFKLWLDDRIRSNGWPPAGIEWQGFLCGKPLSVWQTLQWTLERITVGPDDLAKTSFDLIMEIIEAGLGRTNLISQYIPDTAERFYSCLECVKSKGTTPGTVLLLRSAKGYDVIDGSHRMAAFLAVQNKLPVNSPELFIDAWIAT